MNLSHLPRPPKRATYSVSLQSGEPAGNWFQLSWDFEGTLVYLAAWLADTIVMLRESGMEVGEISIPRGLGPGEAEGVWQGTVRLGAKVVGAEHGPAEPCAEAGRG